MKYEDWQVKPWTRHFLAGKILTGKRGNISYRYTIFVGQWVDDWWTKFYEHLRKSCSP